MSTRKSRQQAHLMKQQHSRENRLKSCFREVDYQAEQRRKRDANRRRYMEAYISYQERKRNEKEGYNAMRSDF